GCGGRSDYNTGRMTSSTTPQQVRELPTHRRPPSQHLCARSDPSVGWALGGYFNTVKDDPSLLARVRDDQDGAEPSSNCTPLPFTSARGGLFYASSLHAWHWCGVLLRSHLSHEPGAPVAHDGKR